jgi:heme A synthase
MLSQSIIISIIYAFLIYILDDFDLSYGKYYSLMFSIIIAVITASLSGIGFLAGCVFSKLSAEIGQILVASLLVGVLSFGVFKIVYKVEEAIGIMHNFIPYSLLVLIGLATPLLLRKINKG